MLRHLARDVLVKHDFTVDRLVQRLIMLFRKQNGGQGVFPETHRGNKLRPSHFTAPAWTISSLKQSFCQTSPLPEAALVRCPWDRILHPPADPAMPYPPPRPCTRSSGLYSQTPPAPSGRSAHSRRKNSPPPPCFRHGR